MAFGGAVPALAASPQFGPTAGGVCYVYSGGGTVNVQDHKIYLWVPYASAGNPGPWYYYSITIASGTANTPSQPNLLGSGYQTRNAVWNCVGTTCTYSFEVRNMGVSGGNCSFGLSWSSLGTTGDPVMTPKSTITISSSGTDGTSGTLKYNIGTRYGGAGVCADGFRVISINGTMATTPGASTTYKGCPEYQVGSGTSYNHWMTTSSGTCVQLAVGSGGSSGYDMCTGTVSW